MKFPNMSRKFRLSICTLALSGSLVYAQNPQGQEGRGNPAQTPGVTSPQRGTGQSPTTAQPGDTRASTNTSNNSTFVTKAVEINSAEIQLGRLALKNSQNDQVKAYAEMMVKDHSEALEKFQGTNTSSIATTTTNAPPANSQNRAGNTAINRDERGNTATASVKMPAVSREHQQLIARLEKLKGTQFDREYMRAMVNGHRDAVRLFEQETGGNSSNNSTASNSRREDTPDQNNTADRGARDTAGGSTGSSRGADSKNLAAEMLPTIKQHLQEAETLLKALK
jgi:putative membrane protein